MFGSGSYGQLSFDDYIATEVVGTITSRVSIVTVTSLTGLASPQSYMKILTDTSRKLIYAAEISPWSVSDRGSS